MKTFSPPKVDITRQRNNSSAKRTAPQHGERLPAAAGPVVPPAPRMDEVFLR